jgi:transcription elongation factor GreA
MVSIEKTNPSLRESAAEFLSKLSPEDKEASQPEINKFVRWYGSERPFSALTAPEIASFAEKLSLTDTDYSSKLDNVRAFLAYAKKKGWTATNLSTHLKAKKTRAALKITSQRIKRNQREQVSLSKQKYEEVKAELVALKEKSRELIDDIRRAAADKDFRENAPLAAAREQRGYVEGRIKELEETMKLAVIIDENREPTIKTTVGDSVILCDLTSNEEVCYMIVDRREVDPSKGKISIASPLGKALIGKRSGDSIEIIAPVGKLLYLLKSIKR